MSLEGRARPQRSRETPTPSCAFQASLLSSNGLSVYKTRTMSA
ncbi:hypothetical protein BN903_91 [Halorubrum sp. AJ67]|nr:hypothetical protein BN903_91 [Halorubrum sp. AJ67]